MSQVLLHVQQMRLVELKLQTAVNTSWAEHEIIYLQPRTILDYETSLSNYIEKMPGLVQGALRMQFVTNSKQDSFYLAQGTL